VRVHEREKGCMCVRMRVSVGVYGCKGADLYVTFVCACVHVCVFYLLKIGAAAF